MNLNCIPFLVAKMPYISRHIRRCSGDIPLQHERNHVRCDDFCFLIMFWRYRLCYTNWGLLECETTSCCLFVQNDNLSTVMTCLLLRVECDARFYSKYNPLINLDTRVLLVKLGIIKTCERTLMQTPNSIKYIKNSKMD